MSCEVPYNIASSGGIVSECVVVVVLALIVVVLVLICDINPSGLCRRGRDSSCKLRPFETGESDRTDLLVAILRETQQEKVGLLVNILVVTKDHKMTDT